MNKPSSNEYAIIMEESLPPTTQSVSSWLLKDESVIILQKKTMFSYIYVSCIISLIELSGKYYHFLGLCFESGIDEPSTTEQKLQNTPLLRKSPARASNPKPSTT